MALESFRASTQVVRNELGHLRVLGAFLADGLEQGGRETLAFDLVLDDGGEEGSRRIPAMVEPILEDDQFVIRQIDAANGVSYDCK